MELYSVVLCGWLMFGLNGIQLLASHGYLATKPDSTPCFIFCSVEVLLCKVLSSV